MARHVQFKQVDLVRAIKGATAAGVNIGRVEIDPATGKIVLVTSAEVAVEAGNPVDEWMKRHARSA
ncbi:hypothetical protein [Aminobacter sp. SS-2016]|uniref:hypothetical protein n=1 Tax=Aminobacter sp. Y103A TaxID=1870862 RepID=UPI0025737313|nr:hypothetical protein [Aminobacter sp. SS-2016]